MYQQEAEIQPKVAKGLISSLIPWKETLPPGPILEVGCGTGFLTSKLIKEFPERKLVITDASEKMLEFCKADLAEKGINTDNVEFRYLDVNEFKADSEEYSLVISNFAAHWFKDTSLGLQNLSESLVHGGILLASFPGNHSFPDWYENCLELGLPHTANPLPDVEEVVIKLSTGPMQIDYYENDLYQEFDSALDFFQHLKNIGSSTSTHNKSLNAKQFKLLIDHWDKKSGEKVKIKWHIVYLAAKKN
ncbi:MAG TPA: methyltransferase domain-containing protein [Gracilimonas sp.]|uniref:methyltransferase domain-containing protein n=1 Tax=Gracilimonas sp. TaxID=1974203 RepID=UPI002D830E35|nr:methyltransferase domain-containing protein [Gracilimonas sp.]